ncbi:hypothetical protein KC19_VG329700 [Ceratodon purpureus]|uniref:Uncharacterized protein n=1 Tax=Ceratodon purpureus TaxID=3225 RepID=A0A8T0HVU9_CERPU|nr:hypothetical protein KC19_VG329700 [Ceratodon purpureus]
MDFATRAVIKLQNNRSQNHCSTNAIIISSSLKPSYERNREKENLDPRPMPSDRWSQLQLKRMQSLLKSQNDAESKANTKVHGQGDDEKSDKASGIFLQ